MNLQAMGCQAVLERALPLMRPYLKPPPRLTVSQWADRERMLSPEASAEPGRWSTARAEFQRAIMDAICDPTIDQVWAQCSAQVGKTEIINNAIGYFIDQDPSPILLIQPILDLAEAWSKDRFAPMLRDTPALKGLVKDAKSRDSGNTLLHKQFPGGHITMAGANSAASLASRPIRVVLCDEVDRYPVSAGTEGDPISLAQKRSATFWNRRFVAVSTPKDKGISRIERGYLSSDRRRYFVPCTHCGEFQVLKWKQVKWPEGKPEEAAYVCEHCGVLLGDGDRVEMVRLGQWRATAPFNGIAGFHIWEAYSPWRKLGDIAADFIAAKAFPETLKTWVNTSLGETWEDRAGEGLTAELIESRASDYQPWTVPADAVMVVAGADVQHDRVEVSIVAFGPGEETWLAAHEVVYGRPKDDATWLAVDEVLARTVKRADGVDLAITAAVVDAGDGQTTGFVLDYCRARRRRRVNTPDGPCRVLAGKGQSQGGKAAIGNPRKVDVNVKGRVEKRGAELWPIGTDTIKGVLAARLREEGFIHTPHGLPRDYYEQLTSERLVTKFVQGLPRRTWTKAAGARNEAWDCLVYAYAAACFAGLKRAQWSAWSRRRHDVTTEQTPTNPAPRRVRRSRDNPFASEGWEL
jgi:phage terminase large subunit GpA-like protein